MTTLLVRGLDDEGPGDIVSAFVSETPASPDDIGDIECDGDTVGTERRGCRRHR